MDFPMPDFVSAFFSLSHSLASRYFLLPYLKKKTGQLGLFFRLSFILYIP